MCFTTGLHPQPLLPRMEAGQSLRQEKGLLTLQRWQQAPWAHSAPPFRVQLEALQQGLLHSWGGRGWESEPSQAGPPAPPACFTRPRVRTP